MNEMEIKVGPGTALGPRALRCFMGPIMGTRIPIPVSLCSAAYPPLLFILVPTSFLLDFLRPRIVAINTDEDGRNGRIMAMEKDRGNGGSRETYSPGNFHIYEVIVHRFTMVQFLFARLLIFIKTVVGRWLGQQGPKVVEQYLVHSRLLVLLRFCSCSMMIQRKWCLLFFCFGEKSVAGNCNRNFYLRRDERKSLFRNLFIIVITLLGRNFLAIDSPSVTLYICSKDKRNYVWRI